MRAARRKEPAKSAGARPRARHDDDLSMKGPRAPHGGYHSRVDSVTRVAGKKSGSPRAVLDAANLAPLKRFGQNFLADANMREFLLRAAGITLETLVLEIGAGPGLFTAEIARLAGHVVAVEIDRRLIPVAREELSVHPNATLVEGDVLAPDHETLAPAVRAALNERLSSGFKSVRVLSNLPYNGAATMIVALLESGLPIDRMVVTVQKEVAKRIAARPGDRENGALTLLVQSLAEVRILRRVPPAVFWPRPKVESAVLEIVPRAKPSVGRDGYSSFKALLGDLFRHPRKTIANSLEAAERDGTRILVTCGIDPTRRAQTLTVEEVRHLLSSDLTSPSHRIRQ